MKRALALFLAGIALLAAACGSGPKATGHRKVVAAFYPLAWAAGQVAPGALVEDLTPPGGEPHDLQLNAKQRIDVQGADVVLILGKGFQPALERASKDAKGTVVDLLRGLPLLPSTEQGIQADPHVWLDPKLMRSVVAQIANALAAADATNAASYRSRAASLESTLDGIDSQYRTGLASCDLKTIVTTHEAFGYLAREYGLVQLGLTGLTPEAEPSAAAIQRVRSAVAHGRVGSIFYEATDEGRRIGRNVAHDVGVPPLPLSTLESDPAPHDYLYEMRTNLVELKKGLRCH